MSHTNNTAFANLPLFVGTDKPAWLTDFNSAMQNIDTALSNQKNDIDANALAIAAVQNLISTMYPIGSIYMSINNTDPGTLFGGSWSRIKDTFLLAAGDTYAAGSTGGEAAHVLTVDEMPEHRHVIGYGANVYASSYGALTPNAAQAGSSSSNASGAAGTSQAHNNMPPYQAVYMWRRTA